jgi:hypothetical protein
MNGAIIFTLHLIDLLFDLLLRTISVVPIISSLSSSRSYTWYGEENK